MVIQEAEALKAEGNYLVGKKKYAEALRKYKKAAKIDPSCAVYWSNMAYCHGKSRDLKAYKAAAQKCVETDPFFIKGYYRLAQAQWQLMEFDQMLVTLEQGLAVEPCSSELLQLRREVSERIKKRLEMEQVLLTVPDSDLRFLGGLPPGSECKIPQGSAYGRTKRPTLPPLSKGQKEEEWSLSDERVEHVYDCFFKRELRVKVLLHEDVKQLRLEGYLPEDSTPVVVVEAAQGRPVNDMANDMSPFRVQFMTEVNQVYYQILTIEQKHQLKLILVHRFLREKGARLHPEVLSGLVSHVVAEYQGRAMYKSVCDLLLIWADILCNKESAETPWAVNKFSEALEGAKRYRDAASIYLELAEGSSFPPHPALPERQVRGFAALAFKRAQDFISAEREYVASLKAAGPNWHWLTDSISEINLQNMMVFYEIAYRAVRSRMHTDSAHQIMQRSCFLLVGLLSIAGFHGKGCTLFDPDKVFAFQDAIKPQYKRSRQSAFSAFIDAIMAPSIRGFHRALFSYQDEHHKFISLVDPSLRPEELQAELIADQKEKAKSSAREQSRLKSSITKEYCNGCKKLCEEFKFCPCRTVRYCSKECQLTQWPHHKKVCPDRKRK